MFYIMNDEQYVSGNEASKILGVHQHTLYKWEDKKQIETIRTLGNKKIFRS